MAVQSNLKHVAIKPGEAQDGPGRYINAPSCMEVGTRPKSNFVHVTVKVKPGQSTFLTAQEMAPQ